MKTKDVFLLGTFFTGKKPDEKLSQPVVERGLFRCCRYLFLYGAVYDGGKSQIV